MPQQEPDKRPQPQPLPAKNLLLEAGFSPRISQSNEYRALCAEVNAALGGELPPDLIDEEASELYIPQLSPAEFVSFCEFLSEKIRLQTERIPREVFDTALFTAVNALERGLEGFGQQLLSDLLQQAERLPDSFCAGWVCIEYGDYFREQDADDSALAAYEGGLRYLEGAEEHQKGALMWRLAPLAELYMARDQDDRAEALYRQIWNSGMDERLSDDLAHSLGRTLAGSGLISLGCYQELEKNCLDWLKKLRAREGSDRDPQLGEALIMLGDAYTAHQKEAAAAAYRTAIGHLKSIGVEKNSPSRRLLTLAVEKMLDLPDTYLRPTEARDLRELL